MSHHRLIRFMSIVAFSVAVACVAAPSTGTQRSTAAASEGALQRALPAWLDDLPTEDRTLLEEWIGYLPPTFTDSLHWVPAAGSGEQPGPRNASWAEHFGKIVVLQSWSIGRGASQQNLEEAAKVVEQYSDIDVQLIAVHTPEKAEQAMELISSSDGRHLVAVDEDGAFCDALGFFREPANVVIDRNGTVRYVGLSPRGLQAAINVLLDEDPNTAPCSGSRPVIAEDNERAAANGSIPFPPHTGDPRGNDLRGQPGPDFHVQTWITGEPDHVGDRVTIVEFWATWCGYCRKAIPHMNSITERFAGQVDVIAVSDEQHSAFQQNAQRHGLDLDGFSYHVALDPGARMKNAFGFRGVPAIAVMDSNWIVRWQGHPNHLTPTLVEQIVRADGSSVELVSHRWKRLAEGTLPERRTVRRASMQTVRERARAARQLRSRGGNQGGFPSTDTPVRGVDLRGQKAPAFTVESWFNFEPESIGEKVTVIEFWRTSCPYCIKAIPHMNTLASRFSNDVDVVAVTFEDTSTIETGLRQRGVDPGGFEYYVASDPSRALQNAFRPAGVPSAAVIDSDWIVRWQGHPNQLTNQLLQQIIDADKAQRGMPAGSAQASEARGGAAQDPIRNVRRDGFPPVNTPVRGTDLRGQRSPELAVGSWINSEPENLGEKVTVVEFWRTSCPYCIKAIPHMNTLANRFRDKVDVVAVTYEDAATIESGLRRRGVDPNGFEYHVASDPRRRLQNAFKPAGVPAAAVIDSAGIVRWQGHPVQLTEQLLQQIVDADEAQHAQ